MDWEVELGESYRDGVRWASIKLGDTTVFSELVVDTTARPAEKAILNLFGYRLRRLLEKE